MPKKDFANIGKDSLKSALKATGLPRKDIAIKLDVTLGAIDKWIGTGKIPEDQFEKLKKIKDEVKGGSAVTLSVPLLGESNFQTLPEQMNSAIKPSKATSRIAEFSVDELLEALESKGYEIFLRKVKKR